MANKKTTLFIISIILVLVFSVLYFVGKQASLSSNQNKVSDELVLVLDFGAKKQSFKVGGEIEDRVWNLLQQAAAVSGVGLEATKDFRPERIDGFPNGADGKEWNLYVNGIKQEVSPYDVFVKSPTEVVFRFE